MADALSPIGKSRTISIFPRNADTGRDTLTGENFRINSFPQLTIDPVTDALYATWSDDRNGLYDSSGHSIKTNGDVFIIASRDGRHWSRTYGVGTGADEVYPAIAAYGGQVAVSFYTRVYEQNGIGLDMAYVAANAEDLNSLSTPSRAPGHHADLEPTDSVRGRRIGDWQCAAGSVHRRLYGGGVGVRRRIASVLDRFPW